MFDEISARHYFIRAAYQWCVDAKQTPHLLVRYDGAGARAPLPSYLIRDGKIVFNVSPLAVRELTIDENGVFFTARFGGVTREISIAPADVLAIYAPEIGKGLSFPPADVAAPPIAETEDNPAADKSSAAAGAGAAAAGKSRKPKPANKKSKVQII